MFCVLYIISLSNGAFVGIAVIVIVSAAVIVPFTIIFSITVVTFAIDVIVASVIF
jgi:hypothetical protein